MAIVGQVGAGKSSVIQAVLGEMEKVQGQVILKVNQLIVDVVVFVVVDGLDVDVVVDVVVVDLVVVIDVVVDDVVVVIDVVVGDVVVVIDVVVDDVVVVVDVVVDDVIVVIDVVVTVVDSSIPHHRAEWPTSPSRPGSRTPPSRTTSSSGRVRTSAATSEPSKAVPWSPT